MHLIKEESSRRTDKFILINHEDSNVHSNNDAVQQSKRKASDNHSSSVTKIDKNIPIINLELCDFSENPMNRNSRAKDSLEISNSKDFNHDIK